MLISVSITYSNNKQHFEIKLNLPIITIPSFYFGLFHSYSGHNLSLSFLSYTYTYSEINHAHVVLSTAFDYFQVIRKDVFLNFYTLFIIVIYSSALLC